MLTEITLESFKGYRERTTIPLAPITLLYGPNSAGKSSIFHALLFAYEVLKNDWCDVDNSSIAPVDLGGFLNLVNKGSDDRSIKIGLRFDHSVESPDGYYRVHRSDGLERFSEDHQLGISAPFGEGGTSSAAILFEVRWSNALNKPYVSTLDISFEEHLLSVRADETLRNVVICNINFANRFLSFFNAETNTRETPIVGMLQDLLDDKDPQKESHAITLPIEPGPAGAKPLLGRPIKLKLLDTKVGRMSDEFWGASDEKRPRSDEDTQRYYKEFNRIVDFNRFITEFFSQAIVAQIEEVVAIIGSMAAIGPMRTVPPRNFSPKRNIVPSRWYEGLAGWDAAYNCSDNEFLRISQWMFRLKTGYTLLRSLHSNIRDGSQQPSSGSTRQVVLQDLKGNELFAPDVGIGISQLLPVVVATCLDAVSIVYVEQPELHIHPALQVELGDLVSAHLPPITRWIGEAQTPSREDGKRFLFETHSEHLLLRILKRIRQTTEGEISDSQFELYPRDVAVIYIDNRKGNSTAQQLRIDKDGEFLDRWPKGFFTERSDELF